MSSWNPFTSIYTTLSEEQAEHLQHPTKPWYCTEIKPPTREEPPANLSEFVRSIQEIQSGLFKIRNQSPVSAFEIRRDNPDRLKFVFATPTQRLDRKLRTQLTNHVPKTKFEAGTHGLPVQSEDSVGGALLTPGRRDWYPLQTEFDNPPVNSLTAALHRHAMQDTKFVIQILFQPVAGNPVKRWWWRRRAYQRLGYLRKEKEKLWHSRPATNREKQQANAIERKAGTTRFYTSIRILVIGASEYTKSRVKELAGGFNVFENPDTGQYLNTVTITSVRSNRITRFCRAIADRDFQAWSRRFQLSAEELGGLITLPSRRQENIIEAEP